MNPLISIIIPTYNRGRIVGNAIKSAISQEYRPLEIIIIDDGSSDNTKSTVQKIIDKYEHLNDNLLVRYVYQHNQGVSVARNTGIVCSTGDYICFLDSDDIYCPDKIKKQYSLLKDKHADCCFCRASYENDYYRYANKIGSVGENAVLSFLRGDLLTSLNTWMFKASLIKKNKITFRIGCNWGEDNEFLVKSLYFSNKVVFTNDILVKIITGRKDGLSKFSWSHIEADIKIHEYIMNFLLSQPISTKEKNIYKMEIQDILLPELTMNSIWVGYKRGDILKARNFFHHYKAFLKKYRSKFDIYCIKYWIKYIYFSLRFCDLC